MYFNYIIFMLYFLCYIFYVIFFMLYFLYYNFYSNKKIKFDFFNTNLFKIETLFKYISTKTLNFIKHVKCKLYI